MATQVSFSKYENDLIHEFRNRMNSAESSEDVKKVFDYSMRELFNKIFDGQVKLKREDFIFTHNKEALFQIHDRLRSTAAFWDAWDNSDLSNIVGRFAQTANHRHIHLEKHREKTNLKIRR